MASTLGKIGARGVTRELGTISHHEIQREMGGTFGG